MIRGLLTNLPFFVFLFWGIFFLAERKTPSSKRLLGLCMLVGAAMHLSLIVYFDEKNSGMYLSFDWLFLLSSLLIVPCYFLYIQSITTRPLQWKDFFHFLPAIIFMAVYFYFFFKASHAEKMSYLKNFLLSREKHQLQIDSISDRMGILYVINRISFVLQIIIYNFVSMSIFRKFKKRLENYYSETSGRELNWIKTLTISITVIVVISTIFNIIGRNLFQSSNLILSIPILVFSAIFFILGFTCRNQPFTIDDLEAEIQTASDREKVTNESPSKIKQNLQVLMEEKHIYLTKDLRLSDLCTELNTNRTYLSQVLNDELKENFNSYINRYRVNHAILLLQDGKWKNYSMEKFAELSGFGSTVSMIRAFKQTTGKTPSEFRN